MDNHQQPVRRSQRLLSYLICTLIAGQPLLPAVAAAITPVTPGSQMDKAANGVPVLNIATPNQAGISHNQFSDYNVGKPGLILNNATDRLTQTQLGGLIQNNPNLKAGKEARGIINEVVGGNRSQLQGFTEVAGKAANVMVVNPYGITCNGCGFINTPQVTLTTGKPTFDSQGNVNSLAVSKGTIIVEGQGLNASQSDALSIIARATEINADIHARDLTVIAGSNRVDAQSKVTAQGSQDPQPSVAVDTGALGGMYANRIRLVSSDKGVGVNLGNLNARQGDITLDASGKLTVNNSLASGALSVRAGTVALSGDHKAGGDITVSSDGDVALKNAALVSDRDVIINVGKTGALESGKLTAGRDIQLSGNALTLDSASQANAAGDIRATATTLLSQQGQMTAGQDLTLNADALDNRGALNASRNLNARATTQRNSGTMQSSGDLTVSGSQLKNQGKMLSGGSLTLTGDRLEQNGTLSAKTQASLTLSDRLTQGAQGEILSDGLLSIHAGQLEQQGLLSGDRSVYFSGDGLNQQQGARITSQQAIDLQADQMQLGGEVNADGDLTLNAGTLTTQSTAQVQSGGNLKLAAQQATLNGTHAARGDLIVNATTLNHNGKSNAARIALTADSLNNHGTLVAPELSLSTQHLTNGGLLDGSRSLQLQTDLFDNLQGATLHSAGDLALSPARLNNAGLIASDGDLTLSGDSLFNRGEINAHNLSADYLDLHNQQGGLLLAQGQLTTVSQSLDNAGQMAAATLHVSGDRIENSGTLQGNDSLALKAHTITSQGDMVSDGALNIDGDSLNNGGALQGAVLALTLVQQFANQQGAEVNATRSLAIDAATVVNDGQMVTPALTLNSASLVNRGWMQGDNTLVVNSATIDNLAGGTLVSGDRAELTSTTLNNGGQLQAGHLVLSSTNLNNSGTLLMNHQGELTVAQTLTNSGLLQANRALTLGTRQLVNTASGALIDSGGLTLTLDSLRNDGLLQISEALDVTARELNNQGQLLAGRTLALNATSLINGGLMQGDERLTLDSTSLDNCGQIRSLADGKVSADSLLNTGKITAQDLALSGNVLRNSGLWQGNQHLGVTAGQLTQSASGQTLSGGMLELSSHTLTTDGTLQGAQVSVTAQSWQHLGTAIGSAGISAQVGDTLANTGEILSQGGIQLDAATLNNTGKLLGEDAVTLRATGFTNQGAVQGSMLAVDAATLTNNGTLVGLQALTLGSLPAAVARMALAATPAVQRIYSGSGKLLTQGTLRINGDSLSNDGIWQAQDIVANARTLSNQGRIQSADSLELQLSDTLTSAANSQIGAQGEALLHAATLSNQGQWTAKNLALTADALDNQGTISGVDNLTLGLTGALKQQQAGSLLSGGALGVNATSIENAGRIQGNTLAMNGSTLENSGRLQGDNGLTLVLGDRLTNHQNGILFSQQALTLQAAQMTNDGVIQGGKQTRLDITGTAQNNGKLLFSDDLTFNASQLNNGGWLQATDLLLKAAQVENTGTLLAQQQGAFTGNSLINQGSVQGDRLTVNYQQLNNSGTVLGNQQLDVTAANVEQQGGGKLLSGGNLTLKANQLSPTGQLVALGDVTATLANAFTHRGTLAAGNQLTVTSNGAIDNQGVMQGQGVNLSAGAVLTNNGKITTGTRTSTLSGSQINLNDAGSVQGGGDISLTSRGDINIAGFTGTSGSLTLTAPGSIINTALLYAGQDMRLQANSIRNQRGDILADNNLWMQRDAAGNANSEIINTSGTIETRNGDITMATAHLLNQRDGLTVVRQITNIIDASAGYVDVPLSSFNPQDILYENIRGCGGGRNDSCHNSYTASLKNKEDKTRKQLVSTESVTATANGGASRIAAAGDLIVRAGDLENNASSLLAGNRIKLTGNQLNNDSVENGIISRYQTYVNKTDIAGGGTPITSGNFRFEISGGPEFTTKSGTAYTAVIQAGGALTASFTSNISNTTTRANTGTITSTLAKPVLNTLSQQGIGSTVQQQALSGTEKVTVNSPQWQAQIQSALQQMSGGKALDSNGQPLATLADQRTNNNNGTSLFTKNPASLQQPVAQGIDTSAWPLPTGNNGYFVPASDPKSPYLIVTNPQLDGLGKLDHNLFGDLNALLGKQPGSAPQETRSAYTDQKQFLGSSYLLDRLNLKPDYDYRLLGDAAFDTRYVSNALLNQTGNRYLNGVGSDLEQMRYLLDNAASAQQSLGLKFGVSLDAKQVAALDHSIVWWEATQINGETVMVPKLYLSPKDITVNSGSVIAANSVELNAGTLTNNGSTLAAKTDLNINSQNSISNLNAGLISAAGDMNLSALGDINNIGSAISGKTLALESLDGSINNQTLATQWNASSKGWLGSGAAMSQTQLGTTATMSAQQGVTLKAGKDITVTGSKVTAGGDLKLDAAGDIAINANQTSSSSRYTGYAGKNIASSGKVDNVGSNLSAGGSLTLNAGNDLSATASAISATKDLSLTAGHDLNLNAADTAQRSSKGKGENHVTGQDRTTLTSGNDLTLSAGRDLNSQAAGLVADNDVTLQAGRDVNLLAATTTKGDSYRSSERTEIHEAVRQQGTEIASGGNTAVQAGRDINSAATQVTAQQDIALNAGNDVNLTTATESDYFYKEETKTKKGFLSKKTTHTIKEDYSTSEKGTLLSGDNVSVEAGKNILVKGSQVVGDDNVTLKAASNIDIVAATNTDSSWRFSETKKSGLMGTGGIGITIGTSSQKHDLKVKGTTQSQSVSTVGSTGGNVTVSAADGVKISGADLVAGQSLTVNGDSVVIAPGHDKRTADERFEQKSTGITLALSGAVGEAINNAIATAQAAKGESDSRLAALQATKTALSGVQAKLASQQAQVSGDPNSGIGVSISLTTQKSKSQSQQVSDAVSGSTLNAGQNLAITATGKGQSANSGDIAIGGSQLKAGGDTTLTAANDILLTGAANTQQSTGSNSSGGGGVGISFGVGNGSAGLSIFASVNGAKGKDTGNGTQWSETTLDSGGNVSLNSGRDTTLTGAQVNGNKVSADVGRNLTITSQQDSDRYDSKQTSFGAGGSFTFGSMTASGYINASQDKMHSTYDSAMEQSGIYAGKGGFDIQVGDHTQLNGAVIASQAGADNNRLETGTLGFSDLGNEADYKVSHSGISAGMSNGGSMGGQMLGNVLSNSASTLLAGLNGKGHAEGTTQSAVEQGTIVIRDTANQQQDVGSLSRDTASANGSISPIFDKEKEQKRLQTAQAVGEITGQMVSIVNTMGDIKGLEEAKKGAAPLKDNATEKERAKWLAGLRESDAYQKAMSDYGVGSKNQMVVQAVSGVLQGLVNGNISQAVAGAANPLVAQVIKAQTTDAGGNTNVVANAMAHAVWGAVAAQMSGGNAAAGAAGAFSGELATRFIAEAFYHASTPEEIARLSQADKEQLSLLGTIAAGAAGAVAGNSSAAATTGALAGKNAVENNALSAPDDKTRQDAKWALPYLEGDKKAQAEKLVTDLNVKDKAFDAAIDAACKNLSSADCRGMRQELAAMGKSYDAQLDGQYIGTMASVYKEGADKVDSLLWQYATADAQAQKAKDIQTIATNWGVSLETASTLYSSMARVHTAAAIGGAVYGMKGIGAHGETAGSIKNVNPGYPEPGRTHNCVNCSVATDATLAGNPASALPVNHKNGIPLTVLEKQYGTKFKYISSPESITQQMASAGSGSRGIVFGSYGPGQPGHVFNVVNQNGTVRFLDGQTGKPANLSKFESFQLLRTN
ncbi:filamentous hemagglutinin N-terminal domain-containing protein [Erwinia sp. 1181_3]|uniref:hemagglutinin repeat-containing protein n=1 Tax=Erwinia sp. 1181_3 TaxID=2605957 RepID=UPI004058CE67